ncbi:MAG: polyprenyl synthetase family protein [Terracoccus sp.]
MSPERSAIGNDTNTGIGAGQTPRRDIHRTAPAGRHGSGPASGHDRRPRGVDRRQPASDRRSALTVTDADGTMAAIDVILREVHADLAAGWADRVPGPPDILGEDLPETLLGWLLPATGKRLRPLMCHWGWVAAHGRSDGLSDGQPAGDVALDPSGHDVMVRTGAALELLHLFALVHDDIMDRGHSRRGRATAHVEAAAAHESHGALGDPALFGDSVAILLGDLALSEAAVLIADAPASLRSLWREMLRELVHGQLLDVTAAAARRRDLDHARRVARLKSGAYTIQRPLLLGALAAGADDDQLAALTAYGEHLGEAFALRDDILGVWGDPATTGKPVGDDLLAAKATVLLAEARRLLPAEASERYLGPACVITPDDVPHLQRLMVEAGVRDEVEARIDRELALALARLEDAALHPLGVANLTTLAHATARRTT